MTKRQVESVVVNVHRTPCLAARGPVPFLSRDMSSVMRASFRYGLAIAAVAVVLGLKLALVPWVEQDTPFLLFFAAVLVASWFGGLGPGLFAVVLSAAASAYFFMRPYDDLRIDDPVMRLRLAMFMGEGAFVSVLAAVLRSAQRRANEAT